MNYIKSMMLAGIILPLLTTFISKEAIAQTQVVKGNVIDAQAEYPIIGATIIVAGIEPVMGAVTDLEGRFRLDKVPLGRQTLVVQYVGYKSITLPNVLVTTGKEVILNINRCTWVGYVVEVI